MAYSLSNICTKNYWNQTTSVKIIIGGCVVYFFETQRTKAHRVFLATVHDQSGTGHVMFHYASEIMSQ